MRITHKLRFLVLAVAAIGISALVAAGCGGDSSSNDVTSKKGPLSWLPADTWLVASANTDPKVIDTSFKTLSRIPAWGLAESFIKAEDGKSLRSQALELIAKDAPGKVTAKQLEKAFGHRVGMAITSNNADRLVNFGGESKNPPVAFWIEMDDEAAAELVMDKLVKGAKKRSTEGMDYKIGDSGPNQVGWVTEGDLLVISPSESELKTLIKTHAGDKSLAENDDARRVIEAGIGDSPAGIAIGTKPLLAAVPGLITEADKSMGGSDEGGDAVTQDQAKKVREILQSSTVDGLVADWLASSVTIDNSGVRARYVWSNPRDLADPLTGSRELAEKMPASAQVVTASASDGTELARVQALWSEISNTTNIEISDINKECDPTISVFCDVLVEGLQWVLEDEFLVTQMADIGDTSTATVQNFTELVNQGIASATAGAARAPGASAKAAAAPPQPKNRTTEVVYPVSTLEEYAKIEVPSELTKALNAAGVSIEIADNGLSATAKIKPGSPAARMINAEVPQGDRAALKASGLDIAAMLSPTGQTIKATEVDDLAVIGVPAGAKSTVIPALKGNADQLVDHDGYRDAVAASDPPRDTGGYMWIDLQGITDGIVDAARKVEPKQTNQIAPTIQRNLVSLPGILGWTTREEVDGEDVGVAEFVIPILD